MLCICVAQELELRFLYLSNPRLGNWLEDLSGVTELRGLRLLRLAGMLSGCSWCLNARGGRAMIGRMEHLRKMSGAARAVAAEAGGDTWLTWIGRYSW